MELDRVDFMGDKYSQTMEVISRLKYETLKPDELERDLSTLGWFVKQEQAPASQQDDFGDLSKEDVDMLMNAMLKNFTMEVPTFDFSETMMEEAAKPNLAEEGFMSNMDLDMAALSAMGERKDEEDIEETIDMLSITLAAVKRCVSGVYAVNSDTLQSAMKRGVQTAMNLLYTSYYDRNRTMGCFSKQIAKMMAVTSLDKDSTISQMLEVKALYLVDLSKRGVRAFCEKLIVNKSEVDELYDVLEMDL